MNERHERRKSDATAKLLQLTSELLFSTTSSADKMKAAPPRHQLRLNPRLIRPAQGHGNHEPNAGATKASRHRNQMTSATARKLDLDSSSRTPSRRQPLSSTTDDSDEATTT
jgi:hypothetical protein